MFASFNPIWYIQLESYLTGYFVYRFPLLFTTFFFFLLPLPSEAFLRQESFLPLVLIITVKCCSICCGWCLQDAWGTKSRPLSLCSLVGHHVLSLPLQQRGWMCSGHQPFLPAQFSVRPGTCGGVNGTRQGQGVHAFVF